MVYKSVNFFLLELVKTNSREARVPLGGLVGHESLNIFKESGKLYMTRIGVPATRSDTRREVRGRGGFFAQAF